MKVLKSVLIIGSFLFSATALSQFGGFGGGGFPQQPQGFGGGFPGGGFPQQFGGGFQQQQPYGFGGGFGGGYPSFGGYGGGFGGGFGYPRFPHYRRHNYQPVIRPTYINGPFNGPLFFGGGFRRW